MTLNVECWLVFCQLHSMFRVFWKTATSNRQVFFVVNTTVPGPICNPHYSTSSKVLWWPAFRWHGWLASGLGCILLTLYSGQRPFPVQSSLQHLALMQRVIGRVPGKSGKCYNYNKVRTGGSPTHTRPSCSKVFRFKVVLQISWPSSLVGGELPKEMVKLASAGPACPCHAVSQQ